ncbi:MAG: trypsin-like peptidase domain-containing protein [Melioribacteraceae bacterium]|nr:trypsin-like peptidase domain-containing protein [Melioribacteraceae bacterium]
MKTFKTIVITFSITLLIASAGFAYLHFHQTENKNEMKMSSEEVINNQIDSNQLQTASAEQRQQNNNSLYNERQNIITKTVKIVSPAIVGINATSIRQYQDVWSRDPFWRQFFGDRVYTERNKSLGSGAIISPDGYILTNDHVAGNAVEIFVTMTDGTQHNAKIVGTDKISDICLLKIEAENLPYIKFGDSDDILIGEWSIALGNPFGLFAVNDKPTVTVGVISSVGMNLGNVEGRYYLDMIQTDAAINSGNSGGALVNSIGEMIGINTIIYTAQGSSGSVGVGFAVPVNKVKNIVAELRMNGAVDRNFWTGLHIRDIDNKIARYFNLTNTKGVIISDIIKNSPAEKAGIKVADIILKVNNFEINNSSTLMGVINEFRAGDTIEFVILRDGKLVETKVKLERADKQK